MIRPHQPTGKSGNGQRLSARFAALVRDLAPIQQIIGQEMQPYPIQGEIACLDVERAFLLSVCRFLRDQLGFELLCSIAGSDLLDHLEVVYHLRSLSRHTLLQLRVRLEAQKPEVESVVSIWPGANWLEREVYDLFGIRFIGHPDLRRILLDDEFEGYPLLKSFQAMPPIVKDPATTQVRPTMVLRDTFRTQGYEQGVGSKVGQGKEERLHPGTPTFGQNIQDAAQRENAPTLEELALQSDKKEKESDRQKKT